jgi:hypothetical protein
VSGGICNNNNLRENMIEIVVEEKNKMLENIDKVN